MGGFSFVVVSWVVVLMSGRANWNKAKIPIYRGTKQKMLITKARNDENTKNTEISILRY